jgi:diguanylate cyclase (GGDEF)-like protein/PAS domain S-box-containing protein
MASPARLLAALAAYCVAGALLLGAAWASGAPAREGAAEAQANVRLAVLAFRPKPETVARWRPLADYLNGAVPERHFELQAYTYPELDAAVAAGQVDLVLTQPAHYIALTARVGLSSPIATLVERQGDHALDRFGGVIFTRAGRDDLNELKDLRGKILATSAVASLGSYQMQAYELARAGVRLPDDATVLETGQPQDKAIDAVLAGRADVGFARTGVLEAMSDEGKLDATRLKILRLRAEPGFPYRLSTRLYPEWPLAVMPRVGQDLARRVAAAVLALPHNGEVARALRIEGFTIPGDYKPVDALLRELRLPPFDAAPSFTLHDVVDRFRGPIALLALLAMAILVIALVGMSRVNRRLRAERARTRASLAQLAATEIRQRTVLESLGEGVFGTDTEGRCTFVNPAALRMLGFKETELLGQEKHALFHHHRADGTPYPRAECPVEATVRDGQARRLEEWFWRKDGAGFPVGMTITPLYHDGKLAGAVTAFRDISEERAIRQQLRKLSQAVEQSPESIVITDLKGRIEYVNEAFTRNTGYARDEVIGRKTGLLSSGKTPKEAYRSLWAALEQGQTWHGEFVNRRKDGGEYIEAAIVAPVREPSGEVSHYLALMLDITEKKRAEAEIQRLAYFDTLTGLPNRAMLVERLSAMPAYGKSGTRRDALILFNVDRFKNLNDARGHQIGDLLLVALGGRLVGLIGDDDLLAHLSADEFGLLLRNPEDPAETPSHRALKVAEKIQAALRLPFQFGDEEVTLTASLGVTLCPEGPEDTPLEVLRRADTALHRAKAAGGNRIAFFETAMGESAQQRYSIERELRRAIPAGELRLYLQPQVDAQGRRVAAEALVRWQHPERGLVPPGMFISVAEESDLIVDLGVWVLNEACEILAREEVAGLSLHLSVNLSPRHFRQPGFVPWLRDLLAASGADPRRLTLEVTEGLVIDNVNDVIAKMSELTALGIHFSVDDFGTGYSSLAYLKRLPIHELKIDKGFVQDAPNNADDAALVETILAVAEHMHLRVVAEGVETEEQAAFLNARAKVIMQGYLYGKPEPAENWLARWRAAD